MPRTGAPGDIIRIDFDTGRHTYGQLLTDPYLAVYDLPSEAVVWEAVHIAERLRDHYAGRPNPHLESMKLRG
jgi:hypothetical protein